MKERKVLNHQVTAGGQPSRDELIYLKQHQFRSIVNLRMPGEKEQPLSPEEERETVEELGMAYLHSPVSAGSISDEMMSRFIDDFDKLPKPAYIHCAAGTRAGLFAMLWLASKEGLTGDQAIAKGQNAGFQLDNPELVEPVRDFLNAASRAG